GRYPLAEHTNNGQSELTDPRDRSNRIRAGEQRGRQLVGEQAHLVARSRLVNVEIATARDDHLANSLESIGHTNQRDGPLASTGHDSDGYIARTSDVEDFRHAGFHSLQVSQGQFVAQGTRGPPPNKLSVGNIGSDSFNLGGHVAPTSQP